VVGCAPWDAGAAGAHGDAGLSGGGGGGSGDGGGGGAEGGPAAAAAHGANDMQAPAFLAQMMAATADVGTDAAPPA